VGGRKVTGFKILSAEKGGGGETKATILLDGGDVT